LTHRRSDRNLYTGYVTLFAEGENNNHYGCYVWLLKTDLPDVFDVPGLVNFAMEFFGIDEEYAEDLVNPENIINSAGAWDDPAFVTAVWEGFGLVGVRTWDGAVVLDILAVDLVYCHIPQDLDDEWDDYDYSTERYFAVNGKEWDED